MSVNRGSHNHDVSPLGLLERPAYSLAMASRLVGLTKPRVSRWLRGYSYQSPTGPGRVTIRRNLAPVLPAKRSDLDPFVSFLDIVDLLFVKAFLDQGVSLQRLRQALNEAETILGRSRFAHKDFWTSGRNVYLQVRNHEGALLQLLSGGQWTLAGIIQETGRQLDFDRQTGITERWFPLGREVPVVLDPMICFGAPAIHRRGILTANVYDFYLAERENRDRTCQWFDLKAAEVDAAVRYQSMLAAA
ncbi:MAG: hypothetical protein AB1752_13825 [Candidatus Zixiibacteriota bacterium]